MMQLQVDKIYYINLRKSVTRNNAAKDHFKQIGLVDKHGNPPQRFEALTGGDADFPINGNFSQGEIGCFASHRAIWKDMIKNKYLSVLILEDDARFELYPELDFDTVDLVYMVYFGCYDHTNKKAIPDTIKQESEFCFQVNNAWHTHAYIIGYPFLQKVLKATSEMRGSIDQHLVALQQYYPIHAIIPQVCHQAKPSISNPSTIKHTIQNLPLDISDLI
jgi:hypothetical protein